MWQQHKKIIILTVLLTLTPMLLGIILWDKLPDQIATHFSITNEPDGWSSKTFTVFGLPLIITAIEILAVIGTSMDPKNKNISKKPMLTILWFMPLFSWFLMMITFASALGYNLNIGAMISIFIGILFTLIGNYLPKNKTNYTYGNRTPWALNDEENWLYTNRLSGICYVIGGLIITLIGILMFFFANLILLAVLEIVTIIGMVAIPTVGSYLFYKRKSS